jgi:hypothetical protein
MKLRRLREACSGKTFLAFGSIVGVLVPAILGWVLPIPNLFEHIAARFTVSEVSKSSCQRVALRRIHSKRKVGINKGMVE